MGPRRSRRQRLILFLPDPIFGLPMLRYLDSAIFLKTAVYGWPLFKLEAPLGASKSALRLGPRASSSFRHS